MIDTFSVFYYGHTITKENQNIPFDEGSGEVNAAIAIGSYTLSEFIVAIQTALNAASVTRTFSISVDRSTRVITIAADGNFSLLLSTGSTVGSSAFDLMGFTTGSDLTSASSYDGDSASGSEYKPQFKLQSYVDPEDFQESVDSSVNQSSSGKVEVITFGTNQFIEFDIKYITSNLSISDGFFIKHDSNGVQNARLFFRNITQRNRFEFMPDISDRNTFYKVILEQIPDSSNATGYRLRELFNRNLRDVYEINGIRLRVVT